MIRPKCVSFFLTCLHILSRRAIVPGHPLSSLLRSSVKIWFPININPLLKRQAPVMEETKEKLNFCDKSIKKQYQNIPEELLLRSHRPSQDPNHR